MLCVYINRLTTSKEGSDDGLIATKRVKESLVTEKKQDKLKF